MLAYLKNIFYNSVFSLILTQVKQETCNIRIPYNE